MAIPRYVLGILALGLVIAASAGAENYALLIGVSAYPKASGIASLPGARNDVELIRRILITKGFASSNITILADELPEPNAPSRETILSRLDALVAKTARNDFVYLHFSGHGAQQPAFDRPADADPKPDGVSEIFLPANVGQWNPQRGVVENSIADYELIRRLKQFIDKGVFVWSVFDACHSAGLMRGGGNAITLRAVSSKTLGIPPDSWRASTASSEASRGSEMKANRLNNLNWPSFAGGYVSFYAARSAEQAYEMPMPRNLPPTDKRVQKHGVMTYMLAEALETLDGASYRQVGDYIVQRFTLDLMGAKPTPVFSGSKLDAPVFGKTGAGLSPIRQWALAGETGGRPRLAGGLLNRLTEGSELTIVPTAVSSNESAIARGRVTHAELLWAEIELLPLAGSKRLVTSDELKGAFARLSYPSLAPRMRIARPSANSPDRDRAKTVNAAIDALLARPGYLTSISWVSARESADVRLHVDGSCLWIVSSLKRIASSTKCGANIGVPSIAIISDRWELERQIAELTERIVRARAFLQATGAAQAASNPTSLQIEFGHVTKDGVEKAIRPGTFPNLRDGDIVTIRAHNNAKTPLDVAVFYINSNYELSLEFPRTDEDNRIGPGAAFDAATRFSNRKGIEISESTVGVEHIIVIAEPMVFGSARKDFRVLVQLAPRPQERGEGMSAFDLFVTHALRGVAELPTRAPQAHLGEIQAVIELLSFEVLPTAQARRSQANSKVTGSL